MNVVCVLTVCMSINSYAVPLFNLDTFPAWARLQTITFIPKIDNYQMSGSYTSTTAFTSLDLRILMKLWEVS